MPSDATRRDFLRAAGITVAAATVVQNAQGAIEPLAPPDKQPPHLKVPKPPSRKIGYAVVGLGELALGEILPAFAESEFSKVVALVSGHPEKAGLVAKTYGVDPKAIYSYETFDQIKDNAEIDVVYIVLPNHLHGEYTIRALKLGKHVLCEKPMAPTSAECEKMIQAAQDAKCKLMIAYRLHYEPYNQIAIDMATHQAYGKLKVIEAQNLQNTFAPNIRLSKATAGGPLGDVGIYCINATRYLTGEDPIEVFGMAHEPANVPRFAEVYESVVWTMRFPSGVLANCACGFGSEESRRFRVNCENGWFELDPAFSYRGLAMHVKKGGGKSQVNLPEKSHFALEMDHYSQCVLNDKEPATPGAEGLADIRIIEAIEASIRSGKAERVAGAAARMSH